MNERIIHFDYCENLSLIDQLDALYVMKLILNDLVKLVVCNFDLSVLYLNHMKSDISAIFSNHLSVPYVKPRPHSLQSHLESRENLIRRTQSASRERCSLSEVCYYLRLRLVYFVVVDMIVAIQQDWLLEFSS